MLNLYWFTLILKMAIGSGGKKSAAAKFSKAAVVKGE